VVAVLWPQLTRRPLPRRAARWLWIIATADMVVIAWLIAGGKWFDDTSKLTSVVTLGGHHRLVLIMALAGFLLLSTLAILTGGFDTGNELHIVLLVIGCLISVVALAGPLAAILLLVLLAFLLGSVLRLLLLVLTRR
jgi:hypothetical protein